MKTTIQVKKEVDIRTLKVFANVRYWENASVNGVSDDDGALIPFRVHDLWCPIIDIDSGTVKDWPEGTVAKIHYKVCDQGTYRLEDENGNDVLAIEDDYVPSIMCPKENGYGDYIIMDIDENGKIQKWKADFSDFLPENN